MSRAGRSDASADRDRRLRREGREPLAHALQLRFVATSARGPAQLHQRPCRHASELGGSFVRVVARVEAGDLLRRPLGKLRGPGVVPGESRVLDAGEEEREGVIRRWLLEHQPQRAVPQRFEAIVPTTSEQLGHVCRAVEERARHGIELAIGPRHELQGSVPGSHVEGSTDPAVRDVGPVAAADTPLLGDAHARRGVSRARSGWPAQYSISTLFT